MRMPNDAARTHISLLFPVRGPPQRPTAAGLHLVRGAARVQAEEHGASVLGGEEEKRRKESLHVLIKDLCLVLSHLGLSYRPALPLLLPGLHHRALHRVRQEAQEALHKVHLHLLFLLHLPM